jgi:hypothetical protein
MRVFFLQGQWSRTLGVDASIVERQVRIYRAFVGLFSQSHLTAENPAGPCRLDPV